MVETKSKVQATMTEYRVGNMGDVVGLVNDMSSFVGNFVLGVMAVFVLLSLGGLVEAYVPSTSETMIGVQTFYGHYSRSTGLLTQASARRHRVLPGSPRSAHVVLYGAKRDSLDGAKYASPLTSLAGRFLQQQEKQSQSDASPPSGDLFRDIDWTAPKARGNRLFDGGARMPVEKMATKLETGLREREWFVTGLVLPELFSDDFFFRDPDVELRGIREYAEGVRKLFDQKSSRAMVASVEVNGNATPQEGCSSVITVEWRLSGRVNLGPLGLRIKPYMVTTDLHVDAVSGLVVFQEDKFGIPSWDILLSAVAPWLPLPFAEPAPEPSYYSSPSSPSTLSSSMRRPVLDKIATELFALENRRVEASSVVDDAGRFGEPMEWAEATSLANKVSEAMASGPGYAFKQAVADIVAGEYDAEAIRDTIESHVASSRVSMFSFSTCPFCRKSKDLLDECGISYAAMELDERQDGNQLRAELGKMTKRTSVPAIFIDGRCIGGCNDGSPGLVPLAESGELRSLLGLEL